MQQAPESGRGLHSPWGPGPAPQFSLYSWSLIPVHPKSTGQAGNAFYLRDLAHSLFPIYF